MSLENSQCEY